MKSADKYPDKEAERRFKKALTAALSMPPIENKEIAGRSKPKAKKRGTSATKRAKRAEDR
jgi:hypothetical protein